MVRCEMKEGEHITIAYGSDECIGYILSVYDDRLETPGTDTSDEVYDICEAVEPCGTGCYHGLVTGIGIGKRVSKATMEYFWKLYGVPESQIQRMRRGEEVEQM
ncbi:hypothetical protein EV714DRAFT_271581 [Schizophyllum commune]